MSPVHRRRRLVSLAQLVRLLHRRKRGSPNPHTHAAMLTGARQNGASEISALRATDTLWREIQIIHVAHIYDPHTPARSGNLCAFAQSRANLCDVNTLESQLTRGTAQVFNLIDLKKMKRSLYFRDMIKYSRLARGERESLIPFTFANFHDAETSRSPLYSCDSVNITGRNVYIKNCPVLWKTQTMFDTGKNIICCDMYAVSFTFSFATS